MADLPNIDELTKIASFLAPGFIILGIRARFRTGRAPELANGVIYYVLASSAYYAAAAPLFDVQWGLTIPRWLWSFLHYFLLPIIVGSLIVLIDQKEWFYKACEYFKLQLAHDVPTAWDFAWRSKRDPSYVIVRLNDGTKYYGTWTEKSFASGGSGGDRDVLLEDVWNVNEAGEWSCLEPRRSALICSKEVSWIEIIGSRGSD